MNEHGALQNQEKAEAHRTRERWVAGGGGKNYAIMKGPLWLLRTPSNAPPTRAALGAGNVPALTAGAGGGGQIRKNGPELLPGWACRARVWGSSGWVAPPARTAGVGELGADVSPRSFNNHPA